MNIASFLRKIPLFSELPEETLEQLCLMVQVVKLAAGKQLFAEGDPGDQAYVIKEGQIEILKASGKRDVLLSVRGVGDVIGEIALVESVPRTATARAKDNCVLLAIGKETLQQLLDTSPTAALNMLHTISARLRANELTVRQSEKLAQLGTLTAGITHDLNNPAAAVLRGSERLLDAIRQLNQAQIEISRLGLNPSQAQQLRTLLNQVEATARHPIEMDALERSDRQTEIENWLEKRHIDKAWELANNLVDLDLNVGKLEQVSDEHTPGQLQPILEIITAEYTIASILEEINQAARQISEIVKALKNHVYLDQGPIQPVNIHEGLDNTLVILRNKLMNKINVERSYDRSVPRVFAYGSELNQVWTNLIDNAIDSLLEMEGPQIDPTRESVWQPRIIIRTYLQANWAVVEIEDNGPGIPDEVQSNIFNPYFTTKAMGKGSGLGLYSSMNIINKHGGEISVLSQPGMTVFTVRLPVNNT
jgi:signal transduction histidine kinase